MPARTNCDHQWDTARTDLIGRLLMEADDTMAIEDPGYLSALADFQSHGAKLIPPGRRIR